MASMPLIGGPRVLHGPFTDDRPVDQEDPGARCGTWERHAGVAEVTRRAGLRLLWDTPLRVRLCPTACERLAEFGWRRLLIQERMCNQLWRHRSALDRDVRSGSAIPSAQRSRRVKARSDHRLLRGDIDHAPWPDFGGVDPFRARTPRRPGRLMASQLTSLGVQ